MKEPSNVKRRWIRPKRNIPFYYPLLIRRSKIPRTVPDCFLNINLSPELRTILNAILKKVIRFRVRHPTTNLKIIEILNQIIPNEYFGEFYLLHRRIFYKVVGKILTLSDFECVYKNDLVDGYRLDKLHWLGEQFQNDMKKAREILLESNQFLLDNVVKPLIRFYYKCVKTFKGHQLVLVERQKWQKFRDRVLNRMLRLGHLSCPKNARRCSFDRQPKPRGSLVIVPKTDDLDPKKYRPLMRISPENNPNLKEYIKNLNRRIYSVIRAQAPHQSSAKFLYESWCTYVTRVGDQKLYGVKLDLKDAFGSVDLGLLQNIILEVNSEVLNREDKTFLLEHISNQYVFVETRRGRLIWEWSRGLIQGDRLSAALCELYLAYHDQMYLKDFSKPRHFMYRSVDDYVFISTEEFEVEQFLEKIKSVHEINPLKTESTLDGKTAQISFFGRTFNLETREVTRLYNFPAKFPIRTKFKLFNCKHPISDFRIFLGKTMEFFYNSNDFTGLELSTVFNSDLTIAKNYFHAMIHLAFKLDAAYIAIRDQIDQKILKNLVMETASVYACKVTSIIQKHRGHNPQTTLNMRALQALGLRAFLLVFKRRSKTYAEVMRDIKKRRELYVTFHFKNRDDTKSIHTMPEMFNRIKLNRKSSI